MKGRHLASLLFAAGLLVVGAGVLLERHAGRSSASIGAMVVGVCLTLAGCVLGSAPATPGAPAQPPRGDGPRAPAPSRARSAVFCGPAGDVAGLFALEVQPTDRGGLRLVLPLAYRLELPVWYAGDEVELVPGRGTPTALRIYLELAHELGLRPGDPRVEEVRVPALQSLACAAEVAEGRARGLSLEAALEGSTLVKRLRLVATQAFGVTLERPSVSDARAAAYPVSLLMDGFQRPYWDAPAQEGEPTTRREAFFRRWPALEPGSRLTMDWAVTWRARPCAARA